MYILILSLVLPQKKTMDINYLQIESESEVAQSCPTLCDPVDCSLPGSSVHGILQIRIRSGLPFPSPGDLPDPGIEPRSPALQTDALPSEPPRKPICRLHIWKFIYLIKFICKTKSTLGVFPWLSMEMHRWAKSLNCPKDTFPAKAGNNFLLYPLYYKQTFFLSNFLVPVFQLFYFFLVVISKKFGNNSSQVFSTRSLLLCQWIYFWYSLIKSTSLTVW